jgi:hypothetical protein
MPECPICRREYDDRFSVFVPPHPEGFDSIECAQRAAAIWAATEPAPIILPTIEVVAASAAPEEARPASAAPRRGLAALAALALIPGQAALAAGVGLAAAGTAASVYLAAKPVLQPSHPTSVAVGTAPEAKTEPSSESGAPAAPAAPSTKPLGGQTEGATTIDRPEKKPAPSSAVTTRPKRKVHIVVVPKTHAVRVVHHPSLSSTADEFISRSVPIRHVHPSTSAPAPRPQPKAGPKPHPKPKPEPAPTKPRPHPKPPAPEEPKPTPTPSTPPAPEEAKPVTATRVVASVDSPPPKKKKTKKSQSSPPPTTTPSPAPPPQGQPAQPDQPDQPGEPCDDDDANTRPGNGYGDDNHEHTGPPGHDHHEGGDSSQYGNGQGDDHGNGQVDDHGNGHGDDHGNGHGDDHGNGHGDNNGNGNGHGHGH